MSAVCSMVPKRSNLSDCVHVLMVIIDPLLLWSRKSICPSLSQVANSKVIWIREVIESIYYV